jgi:hypothetical protein
VVLFILLFVVFQHCMMSGAKPEFDVLNAGAITSCKGLSQRLGQFYKPLGACVICNAQVFQVPDDKKTCLYFAAVQQYRGLQYLSATTSGKTVACHDMSSCMEIFKETTTGQAHFSRVLNATTSKKSSSSCVSNGCTSCPTIKRELKNGSLQYWCKPCLDSYYKARNAFRLQAIKHAGGLEEAKRSLERTDGEVLGKCMECNEDVLDSHERMVTLQRCFMHIGCLG